MYAKIRLDFFDDHLIILKRITPFENSNEGFKSKHRWYAQPLHKTH
jgi:hypothetical protein